MPELKFNIHIYKERAIRKAFASYAHLAKFSLTKDGDYLRVGISGINPQFKNVLADEFGNYALGMVKKCA